MAPDIKIQRRRRQSIFLPSFDDKVPETEVEVFITPEDSPVMPKDNLSQKDSESAMKTGAFQPAHSPVMLPQYPVEALNTPTQSYNVAEVIAAMSDRMARMDKNINALIVQVQRISDKEKERSQLEKLIKEQKEEEEKIKRQSEEDKTVQIVLSQSGSSKGESITGKKLIDLTKVHISLWMKWKSLNAKDFIDLLRDYQIAASDQHRKDIMEEILELQNQIVNKVPLITIKARLALLVVPEELNSVELEEVSQLALNRSQGQTTINRGRNLRGRGNGFNNNNRRRFQSQGRSKSRQRYPPASAPRKRDF